MVKRAYEILPIGSQRFEQRFPGKRRRLDDDIPRFSLWRCNLTALSSIHNIYFVAYEAEIHVFNPQFPSQSISSPVLILPSHPSAPNLRGYLDDTRPNAINNLLVSFLGSEEVVATVRDNGDVDVFLIRHIMHAVHIRANATESLTTVADEIRPVFQRNVGASAWGLDIHSHARVIAVSCNRHDVTIFRFGLAESHGVETSAYDQTFDACSRVVNGESNIPCVAFCNTGDDVEARWLLTTDINGKCRTIDLHKMEFVQCFAFGRPFGNVYQGGFDRHNAGWIVRCLDRRSFMIETEFHEAVGMQPGESLPDAREHPHIWDLSRTTRALSDVAGPLIRHRLPNKERRHRTSSAQQMSPITRNDIADTMVSAGDDMATGSTSSESNDDDSSSPVLSSLDLTDDLADDEDEGTEDTIPASAYYGGERIFGNYPQFYPSSSSGNIPGPIFHASVRNLYLLQPTTPRGAVPRPPFVGMASPLRQQLQLEYHALNLFERLNMSVYLPKLGAVIVASQKGRVIVLALTKLVRSSTYPQELKSAGGRSNYGMRVEAILPTASQEKANLRPFAPLHGIAAGPMQGTEHLVDQKKRWRLMLMYQDHTALGYEIVKKKSREDNVLSLIV